MMDLRRHGRPPLFCAAALLLAGAARAESPADVFPGAAWDVRSPNDVGLSQEKLDLLARHVGGRGCVVRHGYLAYTWGDATQPGDIASAVKPVISTLLMLAVQEGLVGSVDDPVAQFEPGLKSLNRGKDAGITWRHLASQTSGYGLADRPGMAYAYNDFALALYYDTLMSRVYRQDGNLVLKQRLGEPLQFQDPYTFDAFRRSDRAGRLAISVRDLARIGWLYLQNGRWKDRQLIGPDLVELAIASPVPADLPRSSAADADMLPDQRSLGGGKNQAAIGPGVYSFNWWVNRTDSQGNRLYADASSDAYGAFGHGGPRALWVLPSLDMVVAWNDSPIEDHDASLGNPKSRFNQAAGLIRDAVLRKTRVSIDGDRWNLNGAVTHPKSPAEGRLMNVRMVNAVFEDAKRPDFDPARNTERFVERIGDYLAAGVDAFTIHLQGGAPGYEGAVNSAFRPDGSLRPTYMRRVRRVVDACDEAGAVVILGCYYQRQDQQLADEAAVRAGVANVAQWIKGAGFTNVVLEVANEFAHDGFDRSILKSAEGEIELIGIAKRIHPALLVSTSGLGDGRIPDSVARACDYQLIHFNGTPTAEMAERIEALKGYGKPIVCNEDDKMGAEGAEAARRCVAAGASWGYMGERVNQRFPFRFQGPADDEAVYQALRELTQPAKPSAR